MSEIFKPDANFKAGGVVGGYSSADAVDATAPTKLVLRINPTTMRLLVDVNGATTVTDGEAVNAADTGTLILGTDGSNYQIVKTDSDGNLQVDIVSGGGGGTQYTEGDTDASITGNALMLEGAANTLVAAPGTAADGLLVNLGANNDITGVVDLGATDNAVLDAIAASVAAIDTDTTTIIGHVDGIETAIASTNTKLDTVIGHVDGIEGVLTTIDADTGTILTSNAAIQTSVQLLDDAIFVAGTDTYTEATSKGQLMLAVRRDADTTLANTTNEFVPFQVDANGYLKVEIFDGGGSHTVDNNGTFVTQIDGAALTSLQLIDDTVYTDDTSTHSTGSSKGLLLMAAAAPTDTAVNANDIGAVGMTVNRELYVSLTTALPAGSAAIGKLAANSGVDIGDVDVISLTGSSVAHDGADAGNPHKIGGRAQEPTAQLEEVSADNDRVDAAFDRQGRLAVWNGYPVQSAVINTSTSGDNTIVSALGAGLRIAVLGCVIVSDGTTDVRWEDGASGTAKTGQIPLQVREGFVMPIGIQPWFVGAANTLLNLELTAAVNVHGIVSYITMQD